MAPSGYCWPPRCGRTFAPVPTASRTLFALVVLLLAVACKEKAPVAAVTGPAPDSFRVNFETSKGAFTVDVKRAWAPNGADRFYALVSEGFFDENRFFRVLPGFIAQFGANDDKKRNEAWEKKPIPDDSVKEKNLRGTLTFASNGANSRTHQLFVNLKNNASLDTQGFAPIGRVVQGMSVVDSLYDDYGDTPRYHLIATLGNNYLMRMFPKLDYIKTATLVRAP